ncbi:alpha/beta hydrolase family protein [Hirschia litorea]|uniref:Alpha/beta hydrolase family protein n=1 Tax=Hirschia litorea TaxID=1199156 RepID=A0ABW2IKS5_9PROT
MTYNFKKIGVGVMALLGSAGCTITMSDDAIFNPPKWKDIALTADELKFVDEAKLTSEASKLLQQSQFKNILPATIKHGFIDAEDERIAYSLISANEKSGYSDRPLILSCYGSGGDRPNHGVYYAEKLLPWGDVLQFDYPGYGDSSGEPSIAAVKKITPAIVELANEFSGDRQLIFWGHSLGGFVCPHMAAISPKFDGFVYETTALSAEEAAKVWKPWFLRMIPFIKLEPAQSDQEGDNATPLAGFAAPILVLSGGKDKILPAWLSQSLADALERQGNDVTYLHFEKGTHINVPLQPDFVERAAPFFDRVKSTRGGAVAAE